MRQYSNEKFLMDNSLDVKKIDTLESDLKSIVLNKPFSSELSNELSLMPGSLLNRVHSCWSMVHTNDKKNKRTKRYLKLLLKGLDLNVATLDDKLNGKVQVKREDAEALLTCYFSFWTWNHDTSANEEQTFTPDTNKLIEKVLDTCFSERARLLMIPFKGTDYQGYYQQHRYQMRFVSSATNSIISHQRGVVDAAIPSKLADLLVPFEERKGKTPHIWVCDFGNLYEDDKESILKFNNVYSIAGALLALRMLKPKPNLSSNSIVAKHNKTEKNLRSGAITHAYNHQFAICIKNFPPYLSKRVLETYDESDGKEEPTSEEYHALQYNCSHLRDYHFLLQEPNEIWESEPEFKSFARWDGNTPIYDPFNTTGLVSVTPKFDKQLRIDDAIEIDVEFSCGGYITQRGDRTGPATNQQMTLAAIRMPAPSPSHSDAFQLLYTACLHRLGKEFVLGDDITLDQHLIDGKDAIWILRDKGFEVLTASEFLRLMNKFE